MSNITEIAPSFIEAYRNKGECHRVEFIAIDDEYYLNALDLLKAMGHTQPFDTWLHYVAKHSSPALDNVHLKPVPLEKDLSFLEPYIPLTVVEDIIKRSRIMSVPQKNRLREWIKNSTEVK